MSLDNCKQVTMEIPYHHDEPHEIVADVYYRVNVDNHYGEDADGNRGEKRTTIEITDIEIKEKDGLSYKGEGKEDEDIKTYIDRNFEVDL